jgi:hypothetical protein
MTSLFLEQARVTGGGLAAPPWTQKFLWFLVPSSVAAALALGASADVVPVNAAGGKPRSR